MSGRKKIPAAWPGLFRYAAMLDCSIGARLLYIGMRSLADDGDVVMTCKQLKAELFPVDDVQVEALMGELVAAKLVLPSATGGLRYQILPIEVVKATKKAKAPAMVDELKASDRHSAIIAVWAYYRAIFERTTAKLDDKRRVKIGKALDTGYTADDLRKVFLGYRGSDWHMGSNDRNRKYIDLELLLRDAQHIDAGLDLYEQNINRGDKLPAGGPRGQQGGRPEDRWVAGSDDREESQGGLPGAGTGSQEGGKDSGGVAPGTDARKLRADGASGQYGFPSDRDCW